MKKSDTGTPYMAVKVRKSDSLRCVMFTGSMPRWLAEKVDSYQVANHLGRSAFYQMIVKDFFDKKDAASTEGPVVK